MASTSSRRPAKSSTRRPRRLSRSSRMNLGVPCIARRSSRSSFPVRARCFGPPTGSAWARSDGREHLRGSEARRAPRSIASRLTSVLGGSRNARLSTIAFRECSEHRSRWANTGAVDAPCVCPECPSWLSVVSWLPVRYPAAAAFVADPDQCGLRLAMSLPIQGNCALCVAGKLGRRPPVCARRQSA